MALIVQLSDFVARHEVPDNQFTSLKAQKIIDKYEQSYLVRLLGATLFDLFKTAYLSSLPTAMSAPTPMPARFQKIFDAIVMDVQGSSCACNDDDCCSCSGEGSILQNEGMKQMLVALLYFDVSRTLYYKNTVSGARKTVGDVSINVKAEEVDITGRANEGVMAARVIQRYIGMNSTEYPEYNGQPFKIYHDFY